jgi:sec-independent protein translocase protein TatA
MFRNPVTDLIIALVVVLVIFGPTRLPALGRGLGQGMKEFKDSITGKSGPIEDEEGDKPALTASGSGQAAGPATATPAHDGAAAGPATTGAEPGPAEVGSTEPRS